MARSIARKILKELNECEKANRVFNGFGNRKKTAEVKQALKEFGQLQAENKRLKNQKEYVYKPEIKTLKDKNKRLREAMETISLLDDFHCENCPLNDDCAELVDLGNCCRLIAEQALQEE